MAINKQSKFRKCQRTVFFLGLGFPVRRTGKAYKTIQSERFGVLKKHWHFRNFYRRDMVRFKTGMLRQDVPVVRIKVKEPVWSNS